jgi:predicted acyl esterase
MAGCRRSRVIAPSALASFCSPQIKLTAPFLPGHRVRLEISSSNFPRFDRNLNTGEDQATGSRRQTAAQTILHDQRYPSHILLPVIPR